MPVKGGKIVLITGGARSGKSRLAEEMARSGQVVVYLATASVLDDEMSERVRIHQSGRPAGWHTLEETCNLEAALEKLPPCTDTLIIDCLTLWLTNLLLERFDERSGAGERSYWEKEILEELSAFLKLVRTKVQRTIIVSNELGCGLVPETPLGRVFRDLAGRANQLAAAVADSVYLSVAGIPLSIKGADKCSC